MFTSGGTSLWVRNVQLGLFAIPLQVLAVWQQERHHLAVHGLHWLLHGFHPSTWLVVLIQFAGGLITAVVIKYALLLEPLRVSTDRSIVGRVVTGTRETC